MGGSSSKDEAAEEKYVDVKYHEGTGADQTADAAYSFWDKNKTFRPIKNPGKKGKQQELHKTIKATMKAVHNV